MAAEVLARYPEAEATLVDFSEPMLEEARSRFRDAADRVRIVRADLMESKWVAALGKDARYDLVVSRQAIHHLTDTRKRGLYREVFGLLKAGGLFLNLDHVSSPTQWVEAMFEDWLIDRLYESRRAKDPEVSRRQVAKEYRNRADHVANILAPVEVQLRWLREAGFQDVDCFYKAFEFALFGGRRASRTSRSGYP